MFGITCSASTDIKTNVLKQRIAKISFHPNELQTDKSAMIIMWPFAARWHSGPNMIHNLTAKLSTSPKAIVAKPSCDKRENTYRFINIVRCLLEN